jgi:ribosomal protein S18 acetylase RimI-like enzyme
MENNLEERQPDMRIREAGKEDCSLLADLIRNAFADVAERLNLTRENAPTHPYFCTEEWVRAAMDRGVRFFIMEKNGKAVGCVGLENAGEGEFFMERLAVRPEARRQGLGEALVRQAMREAMKAGGRDLLIGVISGELKLLEWYGRLGFKEVGRKYFEHLPFQVVFMSRKLAGIKTDN